jgi:hypothetical protein
MVLRRLFRPSVALLAGLLVACTTASPDPDGSSNAADTQAQRVGGQALPPYPIVRAWSPHVFKAPKFQPIFYASDSMKDDILGLVNALAKSDYWHTVTGEYGVGTPTVLSPILLPDAAPTTISSDDVNAAIAAQIDTLGIATIDPETIFMYYVPQTTTITMPSPMPGSPPQESCKAFGAFHASVAVGPDRQTEFATAILPRCEGYLGHTLLEAIGTGTTHELIEAATDSYFLGAGYADVDFDGSGWADITGGGELSDLCKSFPSVTLPGTNWLVTRSWSNAAAKQGKDPCLPSAGPYFVAYPSVEGGAEITFQGFPMYGKAIAVAPGQTVTVDVKLYAEPEVEGPWTVSVELEKNAPQFPAPEGQITMSLDKTEGKAGDTLHLTITRNVTSNDAFSPPGVPIVVHSTMNGRTNDWLAVVGD